MTHSITCECGRVQGALGEKAGVNHCVCYCSDCQAFARFLEREVEILDERGGTEVLQTSPHNVTFIEGIDYLACMRLTPNGLLRWYAKCCNTPVGNTPSRLKMPFVSLVHNCLQPASGSLDEVFGPVRTHAFTTHARGEPKPRSAGIAEAVIRAVWELLKARVTGRYKRNPFFRADTGAPIVEPTVLDSRELQALKG